jgi:type II secretory pathway component PulF
MIYPVIVSVIAMVVVYSLLIFIVPAWRIGRKLSAIAELVSAVITGAPLSYNKEKVRAKRMYPVIVSVIAMVVVYSLLIFIVPQIAAVFQDSGQPLPEITVFRSSRIFNMAARANNML